MRLVLPKWCRILKSCFTLIWTLVGVTCMQAYAMTEASHQMTSNPLPKHGPHKPGKAPVTLPSLGHVLSI